MKWVSIRAGAVVLFAAILVALLAALAWGPGAGQPHRAPVGVVAPGVVGQLLSESVEGTAGQLEPVDVTDLERARELVASGDLVAAVQVNLTRPRDTVLIDGSRNPDLVAGVVDRIQAISHGYGRTNDVEDVSQRPDTDRSERIDWATAASVLAGLLLGLLIGAFRWLRHVHFAGLPRTIATILPGVILSGLALAFVPALATGNAWWFSAIVLSVHVGLTTGITVACIAASRSYGPFVATAMLLTFTSPLLSHVDALLLPQPWRFGFPLTGVGATRELLSGQPDQFDWRPALVLLVWIAATSVGGRRAVRTSTEWERQIPLLRTAAAALPAGAALVVASLLLPTDLPEPEQVQVMATTTDCVDIGPVRTVKDLNRITRLRGSAEFGGGDVGASAQLQDGRRIWLFGDTVRGTGEHARFVRNSMLVLNQQCMAAVLMGGGAIIPDRSSSVGYWPMSVTVSEREGYDLVTVTAQRVRSQGNEAWDFANLGPAVVVYVVPRGATPQLMAVRDVGPDSTDRARPMWGAATATDDEWLYLYGTAHPGEDLVFGYSLQVARTRPDNAFRPSTWTYWDGQEWSKDPEDAVELIGAVDGTSQTLSVWEQDGTWYALSKRNEYLGSEIVVWTAPSPTGPFTVQPALMELPSDLDGGQLRYMPLAHPELLPHAGTVVVSWSNNRADTQAVLADPRLYRPRFARVDLP